MVNRCEEGARPNCCDLITRDPTTDRLVLVGDVFVNVDRETVSGVDLEASYRSALDMFGGVAESISAAPVR